MGANCMRSLSDRMKPVVPAGKKKSRSKYNLVIEETGVAELDSLFLTGKKLLSELMEARKKLQLVYKKLQKATCVHILQTPILEDAVIAMLYIYSAGVQGDLSRCGLEISEDSPYIHVNCSALKKEHREIEQQWNVFIQELNTVLPLMERLQRDLSDEIDTASNATEMAQFKTYGLEPIDQVNINNIVSQNLNRLYLAPRMITEVLEMQSIFSKELSLIVASKLKHTNLIRHINHIGVQAYRAGVYEPKKVVMTFWPDEDRIIAL